MDTDDELTRVLEERARVVQAKSEVLKNIQELTKSLKEQASRLNRLEQEQESLTKQGQELTAISMAELEALEAEERAEEQARIQAGEQAAEASTSSDPAPGFDWSSLEVTALPAALLGSPSPLGGPGFSGEIPPTSRDNSGS
ncbi:hypothetical protein N0V85_008426 [Neurospora sp. IMI 360204]|nr:hypothetical protein N0V85_008426 [Neurospora sp. IMI 360204]